MAEQVALCHQDLGRRWILRRPDRTVFKGKDGAALYFNKKSDAKRFREQVSLDLVVSPGPDHWRW